MKKYTHIFFDLDHTLWDFDRAASETLKELFFVYQLDQYKEVGYEVFVTEFHKINRYFWNLYDNNKVDKEEIRNRRFVMLFNKLGIEKREEDAQKMSLDYLFQCPQKPYLIEYGLEVLEYLKDQYALHIITNGFTDVQAIKMKSANITHYFEHVITSETTGHKKPSKEIFEYALSLIDAPLEETLMIGDSLKTDIKGANNIGMDCIFYNPEQMKFKANVYKEIQRLIELKAIL